MKQKINLRLVLMTLVAVLVTTVSVTMVYYGIFRQQVRTDLKVNAELLSDTGTFQRLYAQMKEGSLSPDSMQDELNVFEGITKDRLRITWVDADGNVLYDNDTDAAEMENHLDRPEIQTALKNGSGEVVRRSDTLKMDTFYYALLLSDGTVLRVSTQARTIVSIFLASSPYILIIILLVVGSCILISHLLTRQLLRPIDRMAENLDGTLQEPVYSELQPFADKIRSQHENILAAAKSRQDFTANVSHELKTPLTAISGYAELIENHMVDEEATGHIAEQIRFNASRLLALINDIISLSALDRSEDAEANFTQFDLYYLAEEACSNLQINAEQKNITITCTGETAMLKADRDLVKELMDNLIQNAIRYNRAGGHVWVDVRAPQDHVVLSVKDDGIGIPKDQQERVFERFYRVDKSRSRDTGGTGLGLAIVKHIAELHDARIGMKSELDKGTTITVTF